MLGNEELQERLAGALESQIHSMRFDRFAEPEWIVMVALYGLCHVANNELVVRSLKDEINRNLRENGERTLYSAKKVGQILNQSLGFPTRRRGEGYRVELSLAVGRKIHSQAKAMWLKRGDIVDSITVESRFVGEPCSMYSEVRSMTEHAGVRLRDLSQLTH